MKYYSKIAKGTLSFLSIAIVCNSLFLSAYDKWPEDLFYYLSLFSVIFMMDFLYFELYSKKNIWRHHYHFYAFPITRLKIFYLETINYIKRWELVVYFACVLFFVIHFYYLNDPGISLALILILYFIQALFLILLMILIKNLIVKGDFAEKLRTIILSLVFASILLAVFSEHSYLITKIFYSLPLINGFLSFMINETCFIISLVLAMSTLIVLYFTLKSKSRTWLLY
jgi:hypothetical protein